jgi:hypothetical protein
MSLLYLLFRVEPGGVRPASRGWNCDARRKSSLTGSHVPDDGSFGTIPSCLRSDASAARRQSPGRGRDQPVVGKVAQLLGGEPAARARRLLDGVERFAASIFGTIGSAPEGPLEPSSRQSLMAGMARVDLAAEP